jgi:hypothetical protein
MAIAGNQGAELNLVARHGHTIGPFSVTWRDEGGVVIDLTGATFESSIKVSPTDPDLDEFDVTAPAPTTGVFSFELPYGRCASLPEKSELFYIISAVMAGKKIPLLTGTLGVRGA